MDAQAKLLLDHDYVGSLKTATGEQPIPFHCELFDGVTLDCFADYDTVCKRIQERTRGKYKPVKSAHGAAVCRFWLIHYKKSTCGTYYEMVACVWCCKSNSDVTLPAEPTAMMMDLATNSHIKTYLDHLYLSDNAPAIAYGRDILGIDKHLSAKMHMEYASNSHNLVSCDIPAVLQLRVPPPSGQQTVPITHYLTRVVGAAGIRKGFDGVPEFHAHYVFDGMIPCAWSGDCKLDVQDALLQTWKLVPFAFTWWPNACGVVFPPYNIA